MATSIRRDGEQEEALERQGGLDNVIVILQDLAASEMQVRG